MVRGLVNELCIEIVFAVLCITVSSGLDALVT